MRWETDIIREFVGLVIRNEFLQILLVLDTGGLADVHDGSLAVLLALLLQGQVGHAVELGRGAELELVSVVADHVDWRTGTLSQDTVFVCSEGPGRKYFKIE